jgi:hypothetical protein
MVVETTKSSLFLTVDDGPTAISTLMGKSWPDAAVPTKNDITVSRIATREYLSLILSAEPEMFGVRSYGYTETLAKTITIISAKGKPADQTPPHMAESPLGGVQLTFSRLAGEGGAGRRLCFNAMLVTDLPQAREGEAKIADAHD